MRKNFILTGILLGVLCLALPGTTFAKKAKPVKGSDTASVSKPKPSPEYEKLFKDKTVKTVKGFITMHLIEGKLYMEMPRDVVDRDLLIGSTIEQISDMGDGAIGQQTNRPVHVSFGATDSLVLLQSYNTKILRDAEHSQQSNIDKSNIRATLDAFPIICLGPDSSLVFEATSIFMHNDKLVPQDETGANSFGGLLSPILDFESSRSALSDIAAHGKETLSVTAMLSYSMTRSFLGMGTVGAGTPFTAIATRSIWLLPQSTLRPREADARVGTDYSKYISYKPSLQGAKPAFFANRWKLIPSDTAAYARGEQVEPVRPIVFYMDDRFPEKMAPAVRQAVLGWNTAFEKAGYRNAIRIVPFSEAGGDFDPSDIRFSCIKYLTSIDDKVRSNVWTDPRTGEILSASLYIPYGTMQGLYPDMLLWLGASDPDIRANDLFSAPMIEGLKAAVTRQTGLCLGLVPNLAASSSTPTDSLRSASYTRKWGLSPSIMDELPANFVARPGDKEKGVMLVQTTPGCYDQYAIDWLYRDFPGLDSRAEKAELDKMVDSVRADERFRYVKRQRYISFDPRTMPQDLGDDRMKATAYRFENMKYVLAHLDQWLGDSDPDFNMREVMAGKSFLSVLYALDDVTRNIGGVCLNEKYSGDATPGYASVPADIQQASLKFLLGQMGDLEWMDHAPFTRDLFSVVSLSDFCRSMVAMNIFPTIARMGVSAGAATGTPYTQKEAYDDVFNHVAKLVRQGKRDDLIEMMTLSSVLRGSAVNSSNRKQTGIRLPEGSIPEQSALLLNRLAARNSMLGERMADPNGIFATAFDSPLLASHAKMESQPAVEFVIPANTDYQLYGLLFRIRDLYRGAQAKAATEELRNHYAYMLMAIDRALKIE